MVAVNDFTTEKKKVTVAAQIKTSLDTIHAHLLAIYI